jgi:hypothetical protein
MAEHPLNDSNQRMDYGEGSALREPDDDKPAPALISPFAWERIAQHYANGAKKYAPRNWEKGMPFSRYLNSALRHIISYMKGDKTEDHLAAAAWNIMAIIHFEELGQTQWDDLPKYRKE